MRKSIYYAITLSLFAGIGAQASDYTVRDKFYQPESTNVEEAEITVIRCSNRKEYYIYKYFRSSSQPNYRAIKPPYWGNPLGGGDHYSFNEAVNAACH